jgi:hypothetical protein
MRTIRRDKFTEKLVRIVKAIEGGAMIAPVRSLYVFGSYSRGAIECGDLDLILIHEPFERKAELAAFRHYKREHHSDDEAEHKARKKLKGDFIRALRKPGERIQILLETDFARAIESINTVKPTEPKLIWSHDDRNWEAKLAEIEPDPNAGPAPRNHLFPLPRLRDDLSTMNIVMMLISTQKLTVEHISVEDVELNLDADHARQLARWKESQIVGKKSMEILPYALYWLQQHGHQAGFPNRTDIPSEDFTHRVEIGKPCLRMMAHTFRARPKVKRQALIPHLKKGGPNEILVFERGPKWKDDDADAD